MVKTKLKLIFVGSLIIFLSLPLFVSAYTPGQTVKFNIDSSYDLQKRQEVSATLREITNQLYFYIDNDWWDSLNFQERAKIPDALKDLGREFDNKIYPTLTSRFGFEWKPGIDEDEKITVLVHPMIEGAGGYFNSGDEYPRLQNPESNQREMVYLNASYLDSQNAKSFLAHEFTHLITFNQKDKIYGVSEETWLNESRAEYAPTLLGYDDEYQGSNLQQRVKIFLENPSDSLTEWKNEKSDYGVINLFTQYLVDRYGINILTDSLKTDKVGISSLNYALQKNSFKEDFSQIFTNWTIAVFANNCFFGENYCYLNPNLRNFRVTPQVNFLPLTGESTLSITNATKNWAGNWYKIIGGKGTLTLEFDGDDTADFKVLYLLCDYQGICQINFLALDKNKNGQIIIPEFNTKYSSLTLIPSVQSQISSFKLSYPFTWRASVVEKTAAEKEAELIKQLLAQIEFLQKEIARVQAEIAAILAKKVFCQRFENNLYYGMRDNSEVKCLQEFLESQGSEIYPEGLVTGNFLSLTKAAVIRFQEKYATEILVPLGLEKGTGYFGPMTRAVANQKLNW